MFWEWLGISFPDGCTWNGHLLEIALWKQQKLSLWLCSVFPHFSFPPWCSPAVWVSWPFLWRGTPIIIGCQWQKELGDPFPLLFPFYRWGTGVPPHLRYDNHNYSYHLSMLFMLFFFFLFRASSLAYGSSQSRGWTGATAASLHHSHSNGRSEPHLQLMPQLMATQVLNPLSKVRGRSHILMDTNPQSHSGNFNALGMTLNALIHLIFRIILIIL